MSLCPHIVSGLLVAAIERNVIHEIEQIHAHYGDHHFGQLLITDPHQGPGWPIIVAARKADFPLGTLKMMLTCIGDPLAIEYDKGTLLQLLILLRPECFISSQDDSEIFCASIEEINSAPENSVDMIGHFGT